MLKRMLGILMAALISTSVFSQPTERTYDPAWDYSAKQKEKCSKGNMLEMNFCLQAEYNIVDERLNWLYKKLLDGVENPKPLKNAQRAWIKFRDLQCEWIVPSSQEGSGVPYSRNACLIDLTEKRILDLQQIHGCSCVEFNETFRGF